MAATREQKRQSANRIRAEARDIKSLIAPTASDERKACDASLQTFLETCFPKAFNLGWSDDHIRLIADIENATTHGLLKALAMPRGSGKTTILVRAALWAILTGRRRFLCIIASTEPAARKLLQGLKTEILHNEKLHELYGAELQLVLALGNEARRAAQQRFNGELTGVIWSVDEVCFGHVAEKDFLKGAAISVRGITGSIRGQQITLPDGSILRPDQVLIDDPQTKKSAKSPSQCDERYEIMMGDVLGMSGPEVDMSALCACTVVVADDLADRLLDRERSPDWKGDKCQMVYQWPTDEEIWQEYLSVLNAEKLEGGDGTKANAFVQANYERMHKGSKVAWEDRTGGRAISGLQHAYDLRFRDEAGFFAEYQNSPLAGISELPFELKVDDIAARVGSHNRNQVPAECEVITAQIDVQKNLLFYVVTAWSMSGRGHVLDYGSFPDQKRVRFTKRDIGYKLADITNAASLQEAIYAGLESLVGELMGRAYNRDGVSMSIDRIGVDAKWGQSTSTVRRFCREYQTPGRVWPTMGQYVGAKSFAWQSRPNNKTTAGVYSRLQPAKNDRRVRELIVHTNWWKSNVAERLTVGRGSERAILLFKAKPHIHRMFASHCCEETPTEQETRTGKKVIEWTQPPSAENDYWDCLVGTCVLASWAGVRMDVSQEAPKQAPKKRRRRVAPLSC